MLNPPYPAPLAIPPWGEEHTRTVILLHGLGSNAERFGHEFLRSTNLQPRLPTVKFVFPTARKSRSTLFKRVGINQWFDKYSLEDPGLRTDLQVKGLSETAEFLRGLIEQEASILGADGHAKIILGGLSQGCAAAIFTLLGGSEAGDAGKALGAFVGMSGWLPFEQQLREILGCDPRIPLTSDSAPSIPNSEDEGSSSEEIDDNDSEDSNDAASGDAFSDADVDNVPIPEASPEHDDFDPFPESDPVPLPTQALNHIRDILDLKSVEEESSRCPTPVFLGHGSADPRISVQLGEEMAHLLSNGLGMDVTWKVYQGFGHWYKVPDEIDDILSFLEVKTKLPIVPSEALHD